MLPHNHFLIAGAVIAPAAAVLFPERSGREIGEWVLAGGLISAAIDLDVIALVLLRSRNEPRLRPFRDPRAVFRRFDRFMDEIARTGVLRTAMMTHFVMAALAILGCSFLAPSLLVPATLAVASHIASDIPNIQRGLA